MKKKRKRGAKKGDLEVFPCVGDGEGPMLLDDVEDGAGDGLRLLRWRSRLYRFHLRLPLLRRHQTHRRRKHYVKLSHLCHSRPSLPPSNSPPCFVLGKRKKK